MLDMNLQSAAIDIASLDADRVTTVDEFRKWIRAKIRPIFPHGLLAAGYGHLNAGGVALDYVVTVDFPLSYIDQLRNRAGAIDTPLLRRYIATLEPQLFEIDRPWPDVPAAWLENFRRSGMINTASYGVYDTEGCVASYFSFHRVPGPLGPSHAEALRRLAPILHEVLGRVLARLDAEDTFATRYAGLSAREKEIAQWVALGKTNGEIAQLSKLSENTVKHHLTRIFTKVEVDTRSQLVHRITEYEAKAPPGFGTKIL
jgi:DNA-binding CsgD family transcriptional regulator